MASGRRLFPVVGVGRPLQAAVTGFVEAGAQRVGGPKRQAEGETHVVAVLDRIEGGAGAIEFAPQHAFHGIRGGAAQLAQLDDGNLGCRQQGLGHAVGIGAHQSARAELDAAEVAHHGGQHAFQVLVAQDVEHGTAGSAAGFAIIDRSRLAAGQQGPAHMGRARMLGTQLGHDLDGPGAVRHRLHAGDETAFLDDQFVVNSAGDRLGHGVRKVKTTTPTRRLALLFESLVGRAWLEHATNGLKVRCSTN